MNNRLQKFLDAENITQSQFADMVGVARASVSHILSGRNKPGFDFIESISIHYPELNLEWLINGKGKMYKAQASKESSGNEAFSSKLLFDEHNIDDGQTQAQKGTGFPQEIPAEQPYRPIQQKHQTPPATKEESAPRGERTISKIIVFFSDGTFKEMP